VWPVKVARGFLDAPLRNGKAKRADGFRLVEERNEHRSDCGLNSTRFMCV